MQKIFCAAVVLALWPALAPAQTRSKVTIGYASMSSVATTLWAAQEKGFFARNGVDAAAIFIPGSPTLIATLNTGDVHFGYTGGTATLGAAVGGLDAVAREEAFFLRRPQRSGDRAHRGKADRDFAPRLRERERGQEREEKCGGAKGFPHGARA